MAVYASCKDANGSVRGREHFDFATQSSTQIQSKTLSGAFGHMEHAMTATAFTRLALTAIVAAGMTSGALAQQFDLKRGDTVLAQSADTPDEYQDEQPYDMDQGMMPQQGVPPRMVPEQRMPPRMMPEQRMPQRMMPDQRMPPRMTPDQRMQRMMGMMPKKGMPMLKILFAIIDTDEDGSISFEEVTAVHKRIFDAIDTNKDGKVTLEEIEAFMRN